MKIDGEDFDHKFGIKLFLNYWFGCEKNKTELISYFKYHWGNQKIFTDLELMAISFSILNKALSLYDHDNLFTVMIKAYPLPVQYYFFEYLKEHIFEGWLK